MTRPEPFDLERFVRAQDGVYPIALAELVSGRKQSHWMWFVFPQLRGLGASETARYFGIVSLGEARAYLDHPLLGARLREAFEAMNGSAGRPAAAVLGAIDAMKLRSCATLFLEAGGGAPLRRCLDLFFRGERDPRTIDLLRATGSPPPS